MTANERRRMQCALFIVTHTFKQHQIYAVAEPCLCSANIFIASSQLKTLPNPVSNALSDASCSDCSVLSLPSLSSITLKFFVKADLRVQRAHECLSYPAERRLW